MKKASLSIVVDPEMLDWPEVQALIAKGHHVIPNPLDQEDIIFGRSCWRMTEHLRKYLDIAVKEAQKNQERTCK